MMKIEVTELDGSKTTLNITKEEVGHKIKADDGNEILCLTLQAVNEWIPRLLPTYTGSAADKQDVAEYQQMIDVEKTVGYARIPDSKEL